MSTNLHKKGKNKMKANKDIRAYALSKDICIFEIAKALGIFKTSMSRKLSKELSESEKNRIFKAIDDIAESKAAATDNKNGAV